VREPGRRGRRDARKKLKFTSSQTLTLARQYQNHLRQSYIEIRHNKCQFCLGCWSIFLVVFVVAISLSTLSYSSVFFLGLSEAQSGEIDLSLTPRPEDTCEFLPETLSFSPTLCCTSPADASPSP